MTGQYLAWGVLEIPSANLAAKETVAAAGCTWVELDAEWGTFQPSGPGTALSSAAVATMAGDFADCATAGLDVMLEVALQYPPAWVMSDTEGFRDQFGNVYSGTSGSGAQVANWMWTSAGWGYVADFIAKLATALGPSLTAQTAGVKVGGGYYGELHYPVSIATSPNYSFWGYGTSMQTGTGLASGQSVCPEPGYTIFSGTDAQDSEWLNWYLNGLGTWLLWDIGQMRTAGWDCDYHVCHPGYGVRSNQLHSQAGYRQSAGCGEDPRRMIGAYSHDPQIWPYCTWLNTADGFDPVGADSDLSAWKKVYEEAYARNKHFKLWGENTGGESNSAMNGIFSGNADGSALSGASYNLAPAQHYGYQGIFWLDYATLTAGGGGATLANYATDIAAHVATL